MYGQAGPMLKNWSLVDVLPEIEKKAVKYISDCKKSKQPFFLYFPLTAPHYPIVPSKEYIGKSDAGPYGDFVYQVDAIVGNIIKTLEQNGLAENTLVIFSSDNGSERPDVAGENKVEWEKPILEYGHNPSYVFRGRKADIWEGGHRVPTFAQWPGKIQPDSNSDQTICLTDIFGTCAAILGDDLPDNAAEDSFNILPALTGEKIDGSIREATVHLSGNGSFSIR